MTKCRREWFFSLVSRSGYTLARLPGLFLFTVFLGLQASPLQADEIRIGVLGHRGPEHTLSEWRPTVEYLEQSMPGHRFIIEPLSLEGMRQAVSEKRLDFVVTNGAIYVEFEVKYAAVRTATLVNPTGGKWGSWFGSVIFTRADRADIKEIADLKGKSFIAVSPRAWGGYLLPRHELARHGIKPNDFQQLHYSGYPFDKLVAAVMSGEVDAGAVRTDILETLAAEGKLALEDVRVLNPRKEPGFPYLLSTPLYPEHTLARLPHVDNELARQVTAHLLLRPTDPPAGRTERVAGWTTPLSYQSIRQVLKDLKATPYERYGEISLVESIRQHGWETLAICLLLIALLYSIYRMRLQAKGLESEVALRTHSLASSEERLRLALSASGQGMYDMDFLSEKMTVNDQYANMLGYDPAEFHETPESFIARVHPDDRSRVLTARQDYLEGNAEDYKVRFRLRTAGDRWKWILSQGELVARSPEGYPLRMLGTHLDIDDQVQAENKLRESHRQLKTLMSDLPGIVYRCKNDRDWTMEYVSEGCEPLTGYLVSQLLGNEQIAFAELLHPDDRERVWNEVQEGLETNTAYEMEYRLLRRTGEVLWVWEKGNGIYSENGEVLALEGIILDNHARKEAEFVARASQAESERLLEQSDAARRVLLSLIEDEKLAQSALRESEERFKTIFEQAAVGVALIESRTGRFLRINQRYCDMVGYTIEEMSGEKTFQDITHADDLQLDLDNMLLLMAGEIPEFRMEKRYYQKDGSIVWVNLTVSPTWKAGEEPTNHIAVVEDITERKKFEERLALDASVFENTAEGVVITDAEGAIVEINQAFTKILGYTRQEVLGLNPRMWQSGRHDELFYRDMWMSLQESGHWRGELWNRRQNGEVFPEWLSISAVHNDKAELTHYVGVFSDISHVKESEQKLEHLAHHDALTGLPNRLLLNERLSQAIKRAERRISQIAVIFIDIDNFKHINDSLGHPVGDQLLEYVADKLAARVRHDDTVARIGGDEFVILLESIDQSDNVGVAVDKLTSAFAEPIQLGEYEIVVTASMGIALYPQDGNDPSELLRNADAAMYRAKTEGRNTYNFYTEELTHNAFERVLMESNLRRAIENDEFYLVYQPQIDLQSGQTIGTEALIRWQHPELGTISPAKFIPLAEESSLIHAIGYWVMRTACFQAKAWSDKGLEFGHVAINVAGPQIQRGELGEIVAEILDESGLESSRIELEITEGFIMQDVDSAIAQLNDLRQLGVLLAIDDFGTGYSSLSQLKQLPIHKLKIDQSFVRDIPHDKDDMAISNTVVAMGKSLGLTVIAEGVETKEQAEFLTAAGCDEAQGYLYSKPISPEAFEEFLR